MQHARSCGPPASHDLREPGTTPPPTFHIAAAEMLQARHESAEGGGVQNIAGVKLTTGAAFREARGGGGGFVILSFKFSTPRT